MKERNLIISAVILFILLLSIFIFLRQSPDIVLLSFDVEPVDGTESVNNILDVLQKTDTKATFFFLGEYADQHPEVVKRAHKEGHEVACHSYYHTKLTEQTRVQKMIDIKSCSQKIFQIINTTPQGFRAPYNKIDKDSYEILKDEFTYDATQIKHLGFLYPDAGMPEVKVSSIFLIPIEDVIWMHYLRMRESDYFLLLKHTRGTESYLFHPHHVSSESRLKLLEGLISHLKAGNTRFIKHLDYVLLQNDNT